jgi:hypothetical protein
VNSSGPAESCEFDSAAGAHPSANHPAPRDTAEYSLIPILFQQIQKRGDLFPVRRPIGSHQHRLCYRIIRVSLAKDLLDLLQRIKLAINEILPLAVDIDHQLVRLEHRR